MAWILEGAIWKPLTVNKGRKALTQYNRVSCHIAVTEASSLFGAFNKPSTADSHLYVRRGTAAQIADPNGMADFEQYVDLDMRANADYQGNDATVSIETQGGVGPDANGGKWDPAMLRRLAWIWQTVRDAKGIPNQLATSSKYDATSRGLAWHRLGIDGNFPALPNPLAGRNQRGGGMYYSTSRGKACPGDARVLQMQTVFDLGNGSITAPVTPPPVIAPPAPTTKREPRRIPQIAYGDVGGWVALWQSVLRATGHNVAVDGSFGPGSRTATKAWQAARGLNPDALVGELTWTRALLSDPSGNLAYGDVNPQVEVWQNIIGANPDKSFGPGTKSDTQEVQRFLGVGDDGSVGPGTVDALRNWW